MNRSSPLPPARHDHSPSPQSIVRKILSLLWLSTAALTAAAVPGPTQYQARALAVPEKGRAGFALMPASTTGMWFTNQVADERSIRNRNLLSGSGVAAGDVDGDGLIDLYFCGLDNPNVLYRNEGNWHFKDITDQAGVACPGRDATGAAFADVDADGDLDLLVNSLGGGTQLFLNDGKGKFTEVTEAAGLLSRRGSTSMALADIDGDGDLDLYVANFRPLTLLDSPGTQFRVEPDASNRPRVVSVNGRPASDPEYTNRFEVGPQRQVLEYGEPDDLFINDGRGHFSRRSFTDGSFLDEAGKPLTSADRDWGLAVQFHDLNGDGAPDIYVCNDLFTPDRIWLNDGKGGFRAMPSLSLRNTSTFSMGVDCADINRDGFVDLFTVDMLSRSHQRRLVQVNPGMSTGTLPGVFEDRQQFARNVLHLNRGDGTYAEIGYWAGVEASEWSWGPVFLDVDLDGYEDLLVINGQLRDFQNADVSLRLEEAKFGKEFSFERMLQVLQTFPGLITPNVAFRNRGDGRFEDQSDAWNFNQPGISQGMALADLDGDGDLDAVISNLNGPAFLLRNETSAPRILVQLRGRGTNRQGIGARIEVRGGPVTQSQEMICGGRYLSADQMARCFAAGNATGELEIEVQWRSGRRSTITHATANTLYNIEEPVDTSVDTSVEAKDSKSMATSPVATWFKDVSVLIDHRHTEPEFDDFARQPLLPKRLSRLGPGLTWHDLDGDGWDDLIVGASRGETMGVFLNMKGKSFERVTTGPFSKPAPRDQTSVLGVGGTLFIGSSNYEDGTTNGGSARVYDFARKAAGDILLGRPLATGPMAMADVDGDGDLDLFVGGRCQPGRYPEAATSLLFKNQGGRFSEHYRWPTLGLVSGAIFTDLDGDGASELVVACEWGPIRVFRNLTGTPEEITAPLGLENYRGWWNSVAAGDFDGDGRLDLVAGNWGLNTKYRASTAHPRKIYFGDWSGRGGLDIIEAGFDVESGKELFERPLHILGGALPFLRERASTFTEFATLSISDALGERLKEGGVVEANTLTSMVFLNRGGRMEASALPAEAQWSPVFGIAVGDLDGDGFTDLFLAQNFSANDFDTTRQDAGRGLWLRGDGKGGFTTRGCENSGIAVYGDQRACALSDFDGDGRLDLAVTQNGSATRLFHNEKAKPGLRVRLQGPPGNPNAAGGVIQLLQQGKPGRAQEIELGSGYWSANGAAQIVTGMTASNAQLQVQVRWPGGKTTVTSVEPGVKEVRLNPDGSILKP